MSTVTARLVRLAASAVVHAQTGSPRLIRDSCDVDMNVAVELMDELERAGIVGPPQEPATRLRDVLVRPDELTRERLDALAVTGVDA